jgi:hypothetical protein
MKLKTTEKTAITLTLSKKEAKLLAALVDFPEHAAQPRKIRDLLETLSSELSEALSYEDPGAAQAGFVNKTTVEDASF